MSSFQNDEEFMRCLLKGNFGEMIFERLAVHAGWFVRYTGDQYKNPISPKTKHVTAKTGAPDFAISRSQEFSDQITVEVKTVRSLPAQPKKGKEDIRVILSPDAFKILPKTGQADLGIADEDWRHAVKFLEKAFGA